MRKMAAAFNCTVADLENELMPLILDGQIQARIDSQNKVRLFRTQHALFIVFNFKVFCFFKLAESVSEL